MTNFLNRSGCLLVSLLVFCSSFSNAQIYTSNIRAEVNIPKVVSNRALSQTFKGIYDLQASYNYYLSYGFNMGLGLKYTFTQIDWQKFGGWRGAYYSLYGGFFSVLYDLKVSEKQKASAIFDVGYAQNHLGNLLYGNQSTLYLTSAPFFQSKIQYHLFIDPNIAINFNLSYTQVQTTFSPYPLKLNKIYRYQPEDLVGYNGYVNFGIGVLIGFKGKRFKDVELPDYGSESVPSEEP